MGCAWDQIQGPTPRQAVATGYGCYPFWLQVARESRSLTQKQAAEMAGIHLGEWRALENGTAEITAELMLRICGAEDSVLGFPLSFYRQDPHPKLTDADSMLWLCGDGVTPCDQCGKVADFLCDFPMGKGKTCDAPLCDDCRVHQGGELKDLDFCPAHALIALGMVTGPHA